MLFAIPLLLAVPAVAALALLASRHRWQVDAWLSAIYGATIGVFAILAGAYAATEDRAIEEGAVFWLTMIELTATKDRLRAWTPRHFT